jgi:type III restriction enzyme
MKLALKEFQENTVAELYRRVRQAKRDVLFEGDLQAVVLASPTGSGKTVMLSALIERILGVDDYAEAEPDAVFLWLSDQPELNKQSRDRIAAASDRLRPADQVIVEANSFDQETFSGGKLYFLNTQKLGKDKNLVTRGDHRTFTIWDTIQNTGEQLKDRFYVIIDEAHRGMQLSSREESQAQTIMQKFILGSPGEIEPVKLIVGISATPQRFQTMLQQTRLVAPRTERFVTVKPEEVRASGLLKDKIILYHPEDDQPSDWSLLAEAARKWQAMRQRWHEYTGAQALPPVQPAMVIQVEDGNERQLTRTSLAQVLQVLETEIGPVRDEDLAHSFQEDKEVEAGGHKIRKIEASRLQDESGVKFIFFKMSLTTGWDCPRAEVMMSFRRARDHTLIAQLVGRMVRTPLARRVENQDFLNTVALYLPYYDAAGLQRVVDQLKGDPEIVPPTEVELGETQVALRRRDLDEALYAALESLPTYRVERIRKTSNMRRLVKLSRLLTFDQIEQDAWEAAKGFVVATLTQERDRLKIEDSDFEDKLHNKSQIVIRPVAIEQGVWQQLPGELERISVTEANVEDLFKRAGQRLGEGLHMAYWRTQVDKNDPNRAKLELFLILQDQRAWDTLERGCQERINELFNRHRPAIRQLSSVQQEKYKEVRGAAKEPEALDFSPPDEIMVNRLQGEQEYKKHLYVADDGKFSTKLNTWEEATIQAELKRPDVVRWLRNYERKPWSLCIPYESGGEKRPTYPDFLVIRRNKAGHYIVDLLEPHRPDLEDNWMKAKGLAQFASKHSFQFGRIELIRVEDGQLRRLDINDEAWRAKVLAVSSNEHLKSIFDELR